MKIEGRGKYPGVKVHLEPSECEVFLSLYKDNQKSGDLVKSGQTKTYVGLSVSLGKHIDSLIKEHPSVLKPRSEEEIKAALLKEQEAAALKLRRLEKNQFMEHIIETLKGVKQGIANLPSVQHLHKGGVEEKMVIGIYSTIDTLMAEAESKIKSWNKEAKEKGTDK